MFGAREYAKLFETGQYGRLYLVSGEHARGKFFHIFVLPKDEEAISNGRSNAPLNKDAVEVYGIVNGNPGWTESYGWLHSGTWQDDFEKLALSRRLEIAERERQKEVTTQEIETANQLRIQTLLKDY
jgi:hypothetical protein